MNVITPPDSPSTVALESLATRSNDESVPTEFSSQGSEPLPPGYAFQVILRAPNGEVFELPCEAEFTDLWRCTLSPPPPAGLGDYEWWLSVMHEGQHIGEESHHLPFAWVEPDRSPLPTPG